MTLQLHFSSFLAVPFGILPCLCSEYLDKIFIGDLQFRMLTLKLLVFEVLTHFNLFLHLSLNF